MFFPYSLLPTPYCLLASCVILVALPITLGASAAMADEPIRVMSFNIRFDAGKPSADANAWVATAGDHRRDRAVAVVREFGPDILGVQEALHNQVLDLRAALPDHAFSGVGRDDGDTAGEYSGLFFRNDRFTKKSEGTFWLSETPEVPGSKYPETCCARLASWVVLEDSRAADSTEYFVLNTHWEHTAEGQPAREHSARMIRQRIKALAGERPVIVMGDLNADEDNASVTTLMGAGDPDGLQLSDSYREVFPQRDANERTYHAFKGGTEGSRIDYVLYTDVFEAHDAAIIRTDFDGAFPSDHYPVTAVLVVKAQP